MGVAQVFVGKIFVHRLQTTKSTKILPLENYLLYSTIEHPSVGWGLTSHRGQIETLSRLLRSYVLQNVALDHTHLSYAHLMYSGVVSMHVGFAAHTVSWPGSQYDTMGEHS